MTRAQIADDAPTDLMAAVDSCKNGMGMKPAFRLGQVWTDRGGRIRVTVVAITDHPLRPVIIQTEDGDVWAHRVDGTWPYSNAPRFDLTTLLSAPTATGNTSELREGLDEAVGE